MFERSTSLLNMWQKVSRYKIEKKLLHIGYSIKALGIKYFSFFMFFIIHCKMNYNCQQQQPFIVLPSIQSMLGGVRGIILYLIYAYKLNQCQCKYLFCSESILLP
jgi:hypothetical protein